jgi:hypothetical protein
LKNEILHKETVTALLALENKWGTNTPSGCQDITSIPAELGKNMRLTKIVSDAGNRFI